MNFVSAEEEFLKEELVALPVASEDKICQLIVMEGNTDQLNYSQVLQATRLLKIDVENELERFHVDFHQPITDYYENFV